jgi:EAL domain-containing protein (putative c-di-GMP-specific phosphodiesterase class I)
LPTGQLSIVSHNIVSAEDHSLASCEILSRWAHPELGHISPVEFIPVAEESGIIVELGDWVIHQAMAAQPLLEQMAGKPVKVAVNVSLYQLLQEDFVDKLMLFTSGDFAPQNLIVELTESVFHEDEIALVKQALFKIKQLGVEIHIDDFGTGYSSFSHLRAAD